MKTTVIFVYTAADANWAVYYYKTHPQEKIKVLAPTIASQQVLESANIYAYNYFQNELLEKDFYELPLRKLINLSKYLLSQIKPIFDEISVLNTLIFSALTIALETEFTDVLFAYNYLKQIEKKWHPTKYYFGKINDLQLSGWSPKQFSQAYYTSKYFLDHKKVNFFKIPEVDKDKKLKLNSIDSWRETRSKLAIFLLNQFYKLFLRIKYKKDGVDFILFSAGFNLYYYHLLIPQLLKKHNGLILTGQQSVEDELLLNRAQIPFKSLESYWGSSESTYAQKITKQLKKEINKCLVRLRQKKLLDVEISSELMKALTDKLGQIFELQLPKIVRQTILVNKVLNRYRTKLVITTHDPGPSAVPFVFEAKARKLSTLVLLHGWNDITLGVDHFSDRIAVWGSYIASWYRRVLKKPKESIKTPGFPFLDELFQRKQAFWQRNKSHLNLPSILTIGLLLTLYPPNTYPLSLFIRELFQAAQKCTFRGKFWIRVHAGQDTSDISDLAEKYKVNVEFNPVKELFEFVQACDAILAWDTTAIYWPMIMGKPLFYTTPLWGKGITPVAEYKSAWIPKNANEFFLKLGQLRKRPSIINEIRSGQKKFLREVVGFYDGKSSERTAKKIEQILSK